MSIHFRNFKKNYGTQILLSLGLMGLLISAPIQAGQYISKGQTKEQMASHRQYVMSGQYLKDVTATIQDAKQYLAMKLKNNMGKKLAIVLDVDETAITNFNSFERIKYTGNAEAKAAVYLAAEAPALTPVLDLYKYAIANGVEVFFVTGRPDIKEIREATETNLKRAGYEGWKHVFLLPLEDDHLGTIAYKSGTRKKIEEMGYTIILNVGDQDTDLEGGYAEKKVKIQNPFYSIA